MFAQAWGDRDVNSLTITDITTYKKTNSDRPTKNLGKHELKEINAKPQRTISYKMTITTPITKLLAQTSAGNPS